MLLISFRQLCMPCQGKPGKVQVSILEISASSCQNGVWYHDFNCCVTARPTACQEAYSRRQFQKVIPQGFDCKMNVAQLGLVRQASTNSRCFWAPSLPTKATLIALLNLTIICSSSLVSELLSTGHRIQAACSKLNQHVPNWISMFQRS